MKIDREKLISIIEIVLPGLAKNQIFAEQADSFAFADGRVFTFNDQLSISHPFEEIELSGVIHAEEFYQLLKKMTQSQIDLSIDDKYLILKAGEMKAGFQLREIDLPLIGIEKDYQWKILPEKFCEALNFTIPVAGNDKNKPITTCIHIRKDGFVEATDNARLARFDLAQKIPVPDNFLLPVKNVIQLVKQNITHISVDQSWIHFKTDQDTIISSRFLNDKFPKTDEILQIKGVRFEFPQTIRELLERIETFTVETVNNKGSIDINIQENLLIAEGRTDYGWIREEIEIDYDNDPITFSVAPYLLKYILERTLTCIIGERTLKFEGENWEYISVYLDKE